MSLGRSTRVKLDTEHTGENGLTLTLGRNDDAFTFNRFCAVGDNGLAAGLGAPLAITEAAPAC